MILSTPQQPKPTEPKSILLIGPPGGGKSTLAMQFPHVCFLDCDRNLDGPEEFLRKKLTNLVYGYIPITYDEKGDSIPTERCYDNLLSKLEEVKHEKDIQTVVIDGITLINSFLIAKVLAEQRRSAMEIQDWGKIGGYYSNLFITKLRCLKKTTIVTCHEDPIERANPKNPFLKDLLRNDPDINGGIKKQLGGFFTDMWRCTSEAAPGGRLEFKLQTVRDGQNDLKNSVGMPNEIKWRDGELAWPLLEKYLKGLV